MIASTFLYTPYYCEENIWHLCAEDHFKASSWVLFISNPANQFAIWNQKRVEPGEALLWDYHVILLHHDDKIWRIFDFDTREDFGCEAIRYLESSFPTAIPESLVPSFLVQKSATFGAHFQSNREHMKDEKGDFIKPPPTWNPISKTSNLESYLLMNNKKNTILTLDDIRVLIQGASKEEGRKQLEKGHR